MTVADVSPFGSMAKAAHAERTRNTVTAASVITNARTFSLLATGQGEGLYPGGRHLDLSISASLSDIYPSGIPNIVSNFDQFRIKRAEIYVGATLAALDGFSPVTVMCSVDQDDALPTSWEVFRTRKNIAMTSLTQTQPMRAIADFRPRGNFAVSSVTSNPSNVVPKADCWYDASALGQQFLGLKIHAAAASSLARDIQVFAKVEIEFKAQV